MSVDQLSSYKMLISMHFMLYIKCDIICYIQC